ncbi:MAG: lipoyl synthase [Gammaproteobacteria bacterium]
MNYKKTIQTPILIKSGEKYTTPEGFSAIKDGMKSKETVYHHQKKPEWLRIRLAETQTYQSVRSIVREHRLSTVCEEAKCPNMSECWSHGTATIMLMGYVCTRACRFCSVDTGNPHGWLDPAEPINTAKSVELMKLEYVVLTSVNRDELSDGGAQHYADTIAAIKARCPNTKVEALTPDFQGVEASVLTILASGVDVFAHNVETVRRLTPTVRDPRATYDQSLTVLRYAKEGREDVIVKTSLMLGLGETDDEILQAMDDIRAVGATVLTLGQYLQPTKNHLPVYRYVPPEDFEKYRAWGLERGFFEVASGPFVRSSYRADKIFKQDNLGL